MALSDPPPLTAPDLPRESVSTLSTNTANRLGADAVALVLSTLNGVITARALGPTGKGDLSTLLLLVTLLSNVAILGIGEAAVVHVSRNPAARERAVRVSLLLCLGLSLAAATAFFVLSGVVVESASPTARLLLAAGLPCAALLAMSSQLLLIGDWVRAASGLTVALLTLTSLAYVTFLVVLDEGLTGAAAASLFASALTLAAAIAVLQRKGLRPGVAWDSAYARGAIRYGAVVQTAYVVGALSARGDLALVYLLDSARAAGQYSIALTVSAIAGLVPWAVSYTTFAPLARMGAEAGETLLRLTRLATAAAAVAAVVIAASSPLSIPLLFGTDYRGAIVPAVVLTLTAVPLTAQLMLARGLAARGEPRLMLLSYGANTLAMAAADVALIPLAGATGAALGSVVGALVGVYVAMVGAARSKTLAGRRPALGDLMPGQDDFRVAVREMRSLARRLVPARGRPA